jgi:hypothetical protein
VNDERCATCKFSQVNVRGESECHAHPPTAVAIMEWVDPPVGAPGSTLVASPTTQPRRRLVEHRGNMGVFPPVRPDVWCGEWQLAPRRDGVVGLEPAISTGSNE